MANMKKVYSMPTASAIGGKNAATRNDIRKLIPCDIGEMTFFAFNEKTSPTRTKVTLPTPNEKPIKYMDRNTRVKYSTPSTLELFLK